MNFHEGCAVVVRIFFFFLVAVCGFVDSNSMSDSETNAPQDEVSQGPQQAQQPLAPPKQEQKATLIQIMNALEDTVGRMDSSLEQVGHPYYQTTHRHQCYFFYYFFLFFAPSKFGLFFGVCI
jgi:hypothetical protein